jgi:hypothetical protein
MTLTKTGKTGRGCREHQLPASISPAIVEDGTADVEVDASGDHEGGSRRGVVGDYSGRSVGGRYSCLSV